MKMIFLFFRELSLMQKISFFGSIASMISLFVYFFPMNGVTEDQVDRTIAEPSTTPASSEYPGKNDQANISRLIILVAPFENHSGLRDEIIIDKEDPNKLRRIKISVDRYTEAPRALLEDILSGYPNISLIERQRLDKILQEAEYGRRTGYVDSNYIIEVGEQLGATTIAFGTLVSINTAVSSFRGYGIQSKRNVITATIRFRFVDIQSTKIVFSTTAKGASSTDVSQYGSLSQDDGAYDAVEDAISNLSTQTKFVDFIKRI